MAILTQGSTIPITKTLITAGQGTIRLSYGTATGQTASFDVNLDKILDGSKTLPIQSVNAIFTGWELIGNSFVVTGDTAGTGSFVTASSANDNITSTAVYNIKEGVGKLRISLSADEDKIVNISDIAGKDIFITGSDINLEQGAVVFLEEVSSQASTLISNGASATAVTVKGGVGRPVLNDGNGNERGLRINETAGEFTLATGESIIADGGSIVYHS